MSGIVFLRTREFDPVVKFYRERVGMTTWLEQPGIAILRHGNLLLGFCRQEAADTQGVFTFFYETRAEVDAMHGRLADVALGPPKENPKYRIYHFYGRDPEGRSIEFQQFLHPVNSQPLLDRFGGFDYRRKPTYTVDSVAIKAIYRPADELMANAVRDLFEANGIPAMIRSFQIPAYDGLARIMRPVWGEVLVDEEDMARAKELLDAFLAPDAGDAGKQE